MIVNELSLGKSIVAYQDELTMTSHCLNCVPKGDSPDTLSTFWTVA